MKILFDATTLTDGVRPGGGRSGIFFVTLNILRELRKRKDIDVVLYFNPQMVLNAYAVWKQFPEFTFAQHFKRPLLFDVYWKITDFHQKIFSWTFFRKPFALIMWLIQKYYKLCYKLEFDDLKIESLDVYFSPFYDSPKWLKKYPRVKRYTLLHDAIPLLIPHYEKNKQLLVNIFGSFDEKDFFFCNSVTTKNDCSKFIKTLDDENSQILYLAANQSFKRIEDNLRLNEVKNKYKIPKEKKFVFCLCTLEPRKNLIRAVTTFVHFLNKNKIENLCLVLGGGHWDSFITELKKHEVNWNPKQIIRAGYVDDDDLPILYSGAEWFVYTSQYEGFGLPPLEAMQCGCPVIVSNNSSLPEVVGDAGILIDWDSDEQHVAAYEKYYFDKKFRDMKAADGLERAKLFSWEKTVDQMLLFMKQKSFSI